MDSDRLSRPWTLDDVPPGPYFHGSRHRYEIGDRLHTGVVSNQPDREDYRQMCFATTDQAAALQWTYQRCRQHGPVMYVYEVELVEPMVDVNMHNERCWLSADEIVTSVMASKGTVMRLVESLHDDDWPGAKLF